jgi:hypothetical protein
LHTTIRRRREGRDKNIDILVAGDVDFARDVDFVEILSSGPVADRSRWSSADQGPRST